MADLLTHQPETPVVDLLREMKELLREVKLVQAVLYKEFDGLGRRACLDSPLPWRKKASGVLMLWNLYFSEMDSPHSDLSVY